MGIWNRDSSENLSNIILKVPDFGESDYPKSESQVQNESVLSITHRAPGIVEIKSRYESKKSLVISGGIHGDEKAGIVILDRLFNGIVSGEIPVHKNLLLMYGNLEAMRASNGNGVRCVEPESGVTANLNRCFNKGFFQNPKNYAERRANQLMKAMELFAETSVSMEVIDIHQSFAVPHLNDVRKGSDDRTEYTYAMLYPYDYDQTLEWLYHYYSDIVAGAVINDMQKTHHTFAGYAAAEFNAYAATFEQGTIGHVDYVTFTPQLFDNLVRNISGKGRLDSPLSFDLWRYVRHITKDSPDFTFLDREGDPLEEAPLDFVPLWQGGIARSGSKTSTLEEGERLLFANPKVPLGDRAAAIITGVSDGFTPDIQTTA